MPIYEYTCSFCEHHVEILQKFSDAPLTTCPTCQKEGLSKLISNTSFQLKGTGWYVTDIRDKDKPKTAKKEGEGTESAAPTNEKEKDKPKIKEEKKSTDTGSSSQAAS
jgi:putative FmdB family regulatory protein